MLIQPNTLFTGKNVYWLPQMSSTNTISMEMLAENPPEGTLIITDNQVSGKGQKGNSWFTEAHKNLTFSLIYYPHFLPAADLYYLSKITSLAVFRGLSSFLPNEDISIKWPNDILIKRKKVAGILIENQFEGSRIRATVIGVGININQDIFPDYLSETATALCHHTPHRPDLARVLESIMIQMEEVYLQLKGGHKSRIDQAYLHHLFGYQETVMLEIAGKPVPSMIIGVDRTGRLAVQHDQKLSYFNLKEVKFILP